MRGLKLLALVTLAACSQPSAQGTGYRDGETRIGSAALFQPARFADVWHTVAAFGPEAGCGPLAETWVPEGPGRFRVTGTACGPSGSRAFAAMARVSGPGRFVREGTRGAEELWVLWTDADYRVAAIGTPGGQFGRIVSRSPQVRPDLMRAAREVLDFNGYDTSRLVPVQR